MQTPRNPCLRKIDIYEEASTFVSTPMRLKTTVDVKLILVKSTITSICQGAAMKSLIRLFLLLSSTIPTSFGKSYTLNFRYMIPMRGNIIYISTTATTW